MFEAPEKRAQWLVLVGSKVTCLKNCKVVVILI